MFYDLRDYLDKVKELGEFRLIERADWDGEIGAITELVNKPGMPLLLFDKIKDYPQGYRVISNPLGSYRRVALLYMPTQYWRLICNLGCHRTTGAWC